MISKKAFLFSAAALMMTSNAFAVIDTFTRADGGTATDSLGTTEVGGIPYTEWGTTGGTPIDIAQIAGGKLVITGDVSGSSLSNPGAAQLDIPGGGTADIKVAFDVDWDTNGVTAGSALNNSAFVQFHRQDGAAFSNSDSSIGLIHVEMFANGNIVVREKIGNSTATILNTPYDSAGTALGSLAGVNSFSTGTETHYEYDLVGDNLKISVNNVEIINHTLDGSLPDSAAENLIAIGKNRWTSSSAATPQHIIFDNLEIDPIPEPASLALIGLGGLMLLKRRRS